MRVEPADREPSRKPLKLRPRAATSGLSDKVVGKVRKDAPRGYIDDFPDNLNAAIDVHNLKHPEHTISSKQPLGIPGSYGAVFKSKHGVTKLDSSESEPRLYARLPLRLKNHPIIPKHTSTGSIRLPKSWNRGKTKRTKLSTISREDLKDIPSGSTIADRLDTLKAQTNQAMSDSEPHEERPAINSELSIWHKENQAHKTLTDSEKKHLKTFAGGFRRLVKYGIVPRDLHRLNLGQRKDGSIAIRDLGIYRVLRDKAPNNKEIKLPPRAHNMTRSTSKLKALRDHNV